MKQRTGSEPRRFRERGLDDLQIEDDKAFQRIPHYAFLKRTLRTSGYRFRVLPRSTRSSWDRALLLNLTFWRPDEGGDVLTDETIPADVVAHVAWHHLTASVLADPAGSAPLVSSLFMGESIASAFDLYMVGRLLVEAPDALFLATQIPAMTETLSAAGVTEDECAELLRDIAEAPDSAFADLRELLFDVAMALYGCNTAESALAVLERFQTHRFSGLLHRFELSNWVLYARAHGRPAPSSTPAHRLDDILRRQRKPLVWLTSNWKSALRRRSIQRRLAP